MKNSKKSYIFHMQVQVFKCTGYYFKYFYYGRNHDIMLKDYVPSKVFWTHVSHQLFNSSLLPRRYYFPILQRRYLVTKCLLFKCHQNIFKWSCFFNRVSLLTYTLVTNWDFPVAAEKQGDYSSGDKLPWPACSGPLSCLPRCRTELTVQK